MTAVKLSDQSPPQASRPTTRCRGGRRRILQVAEQGKAMVPLPGTCSRMVDGWTQAADGGEDHQAGRSLQERAARIIHVEMSKAVRSTPNAQIDQTFVKARSWNRRAAPRIVAGGTPAASWRSPLRNRQRCSPVSRRYSETSNAIHRLVTDDRQEELNSVTRDDLAAPTRPRSGSVSAESHLTGTPDGPPASASRRRSRLRYAAALVSGIFLILPILAVATAWPLRGIHLPSVAEVTSRRVIELQSADGQDLWRTGHLKLAPIDATKMPADVINAVLSIEDRQFYHHGAIDLLSVLRALRENIEAGKIVAGGSTITQQLAKTLFSVRSELTGARSRRRQSRSGWSIT